MVLSKRDLPREFLEKIGSQFSSDFFTQDENELETFGRDWTRIYELNPRGLVFPRSTQEVSDFLKLCTQFQIPVVPSGGRTGLAGGAVACQGEVILSLARMKRMDPVDSLAQTVRVQAGAVTEAVHQWCAPHGLTWPVDFASKGTSQVGGNIATNAGGVKVIRYGLTRNWVLGLQVVTMQGQVLELNGALEKNNTGLDLRQLFIGSEGTLGVVTEAILKLARNPGKLDVFFFAVKDIPKVLELFQAVRGSPWKVMAFEFLTKNCLDVVKRIRNLNSPFAQDYPAYVLLEIERSDSDQVELDTWLEDLFTRKLVEDGTFAQSSKEAQFLWSLREGVSESLSVQGFVHKNDISLPIAHLDGFIREMYQLFTKRHSTLEIFLFGHIGDGNLHVNTMKPKMMEKSTFVEICKDADQDLFTLVKKHQGSISAEHGIGLLKKKFLAFSRTTEELRLLKELKKVFDPLNLLNPGKIFD